MGVGLGTPVPICCEKSPWVIVCMVSIMKAGGVPSDPEHQLERRRELVSDSGACHLIVFPSTVDACQNLTPSNIIIDYARFFLYEP